MGGDPQIFKGEAEDSAAQRLKFWNIGLVNSQNNMILTFFRIKRAWVYQKFRAPAARIAPPETDKHLIRSPGSEI